MSASEQRRFEHRRITDANWKKPTTPFENNFTGPLSIIFSFLFYTLVGPFAVYYISKRSRKVFVPLSPPIFYWIRRDKVRLNRFWICAFVI